MLGVCAKRTLPAVLHPVAGTEIRSAQSETRLIAAKREDDEEEETLAPLGRVTAQWVEHRPQEHRYPFLSVCAVFWCPNNDIAASVQNFLFPFLILFF